MIDPVSRVAVLTEEHLAALIHEAAVRAVNDALEASAPQRGLKVSEVAERLSCAESTVYGLVERGQLPVIRLGSAIRVVESALNEWIHEQSAGRADVV